MDFWQDSFVLDLTMEETYFYIYLLTNSKTTQCGIYELPKKVMMLEGKLDMERVNSLIKKFENCKKIVYSEMTNELFIVNWVKYNKISSPKVFKCIEKELRNVKNIEFIKLFIEQCNKYGYSIEGYDFIIKNSNHPYGEEQEQEIEQEREREEEQYKEKEYGEEKIVAEKVKEFVDLYEKNIGKVNKSVNEWLGKVSKTIDIGLFKRAIEIAKFKGKCEIAYAKGILNNWESEGIRSLEDLKIYEKRLDCRGNSDGRVSEKFKNESKFNTKPTKELLEEARRIRA